MSVKLHLPVYLRPYTGGAEAVEVNGDTAKACLNDLVARFPEVERMLFAASGEVHDYVSVFLNSEFACGDELERRVEDGADIRLLYVISGG